MIEIKTATPLDFDSIEPHPKIAESDKAALARCRNLPAYVASYNDEVLGVFGFTSIWDGVVEAWSITTPAVVKYPKAYYTVMKEILNAGIKDVHRIQVTVSCDFTESVRCMERLGFIKEGELKKYGPSKKDFYMFGRIY